MFYILYILFIVLTINNHSSAGSVALDLSVRTWVRSQVPALSLFSFPLPDPARHNLKRLPYDLNVQPLDALLPRSNASSLKVHGARSSQRLHLIQRGQLGLSFVGPKFRFSPPSSAMQTGPNIYFLSLFIFFNYFPFLFN